MFKNLKTFFGFQKICKTSLDIQNFDVMGKNKMLLFDDRILDFLEPAKYYRLYKLKSVTISGRYKKLFVCNYQRKSISTTKEICF